MMLWVSLQCVIVVFPDHTLFVVGWFMENFPVNSVS